MQREVGTVIQRLLRILQKVDFTVLRPGTVIVAHKPKGIIKAYIGSTFEADFNAHILGEIAPKLLTSR